MYVIYLVVPWVMLHVLPNAAHVARVAGRVLGL